MPVTEVEFGSLPTCAQGRISEAVLSAASDAQGDRYLPPRWLRTRRTLRPQRDNPISASLTASRTGAADENEGRPVVLWILLMYSRWVSCSASGGSLRV